MTCRPCGRHTGVSASDACHRVRFTETRTSFLHTEPWKTNAQTLPTNQRLLDSRQGVCDLCEHDDMMNEKDGGCAMYANGVIKTETNALALSLCVPWASAQLVFLSLSLSLSLSLRALGECSICDEKRDLQTKT